MATKYVYRARTETARETRRGVFERLRVPAAPSRARFSLLSIGILAFAIFVLLYARDLPAFRFLGQPVLHGEGVIIEKLSGPGGGREEAPLLRFAITTPEGARIEAERPVPPELWERLNAGDRVGLLFQVSRDGGSARVRQVGQVALPKPIQ
ncbi:MAG: hypothetical protein KA184_06540 [Candidatus Hydrogenedentes bacterium]|nr:hypothetical protein [Candidatus Hydrogenedentota bacterium]